MLLTALALQKPFLAFNWHLVWLVIASLLGGMINAVAGGGSFLVFPALLGMGMNPIQANATNTVAQWPGQLFSIAAYQASVRRYLRLAAWMGAGGLIGGTLGAIVLLHTGSKTFMHLVPWLLLFAAVLFAISTPVSNWLIRRAAAHTEDGKRRPIRVVPIFFATIVVCFYIGYFGAGAGFLILSLLAIFGFEDMVAMNALKVVTTTLANGMAFLLFIFSGQVVWNHCLLAMAASALGGYSSARLSHNLNPKLLRAIVVGIGLSMAAYFFWNNAH